MLLFAFASFTCILLCSAQRNTPVPQENVLQSDYPTNLLIKLSEAIGNFSLELLYAAALQGEQNLILSPITAWTVLTVTAEGALGDTRKQLNRALRISANRTSGRQKFQELARWLVVNTATIQLAKFNGIFVDKKKSLESDFQRDAKTFYDAQVLETDFRDAIKTAKYINQGISALTRGRIPKLVEASDFVDIEMIISSAVYFKGQWTSPFNASSTTKQPFYNGNGTKLGEVNMMYNPFTYPFANIKDIQARVIELPYGNENRLSMLMMLPNPGVSLRDMFLNFLRVPLNKVFAELKQAQEEFGDDEVDCFIPRFKIESNLNLKDFLENSMGITNLFNPQKANLGRLARHPLYVTKVIHKAEIEVTEEGTTASPEIGAKYSNRISGVKFEANRPFSYLIVEKVTNAILFGGVYQQPSLY